MTAERNNATLARQSVNNGGENTNTDTQEDLRSAQLQPSNGHQPSLRERTSWHDTQIEYPNVVESVDIGVPGGDSQTCNLTLMDDIFSLPEAINMNRHIPHSDPQSTDEFFNMQDSQCAELFYMDDVFANPEPISVAEYLAHPEPIFMDDIFHNETSHC